MSYKPKGIGNDISGFYMNAVNRSKNDFMGAFGNVHSIPLIAYMQTTIPAATIV